VSEVNYDAAAYPVRADFSEAHSRYWQYLAGPGTWLSGAERVAIAREVRQAGSCELCRQRKAALSPYQVDGAHDVDSDLPSTMVEVVHRVISDSARLTKAWYDGMMEQGLGAEKYVETIGTLVHVFSIDEFCRGLGLPLHRLPDPREGEPSYYRPATIVEDGEGAWVPLLPSTVDSGPEADLWESRTGFVIRALSLVPDEVRSLVDLLQVHYLPNNQIWNLTRSPYGTLSRIQTEMVASRVSALNGCFY
jgi:hypothetical protein